MPRASDTKEIQKMPWARGYPSRVGTEAGRQGLPFSPVVLVFSISANTRNDVHKRKANNTWEGPKSKCLLISWLQSPSAVILEPRKIKSDTVSTVSPSISHEVMGPDAMIFVF